MRTKPDRMPAALAILPNTRKGISESLGISIKVAGDLLKDMERAKLCHVSRIRIQNERAVSSKLYLRGPAPVPLPGEVKFSRDLLLPKRFKKDLPDEPRIDPTLNLYQEPLNALFGIGPNGLSSSTSDLAS